jgi:hypothetical protein
VCCGLPLLFSAPPTVGLLWEPSPAHLLGFSAIFSPASLYCIAYTLAALPQSVQCSLRLHISLSLTGRSKHRMTAQFKDPQGLALDGENHHCISYGNGVSLKRMHQDLKYVCEYFPIIYCYLLLIMIWHSNYTNLYKHDVRTSGVNVEDFLDGTAKISAQIVDSLELLQNVCIVVVLLYF